MRKVFAILFAVFLCSQAVLRAECTAVYANWSLSNEWSFKELTATGNGVWTYDASYACAVASGAYNEEAWLLTPAFALQGSAVVMFRFDHAHKFAGVPAEELTLCVTSDYTGDPATTSWQALPINYTDNNSWTFKTNTITVPVSYVGPQTVFGFHYKATSSNRAKWELRNISLLTTCKDGEKASRPLRVCGQNLQNYYYNYSESSRPKYHDAAGLAQKTMRIVLAALQINADIYAFCEVEAKPIVLAQLADSLNKYCGVPGRYAAVSDGINRTTDSHDNALKSGFIYRTDRVGPIGSNTAASSYTYYEDVMRIQAFQERSSGGRFVLSMNHFKAKDSSSDGGESTRNTNAQQLVSALKSVTTDPDILVLGDLNSMVSESPVKKILNAGFTEQILRYDPDAFSYCYSGEGQLIDHAFANASMAAQVVNARMVHICTSGCGYSNSAISYSDHDPYVVEICLQENGICLFEGIEEVRSESTDVVRSEKILRDGRLYIVIGDAVYDIMGQKVQ